MLVTTTELTTGERLRVKRRRMGLTQAEQAEQIGMPLGAYKRAEADDTPECWDIEPPSIGRLEPHEACLVMRRRAGLTLDDLSYKIGLSKWWLCLMEQGKVPTSPRLLAHWTR